MTGSDLEFHQVDRDRWPDLERLFESRGGPHNCWCMVWRDKPLGMGRMSGGARKEALKAGLHSRVEDNTPIGIIGYSRGAPIAWCSVAPRLTYRPLGGPKAASDEGAIWSIVCFFVKREVRGQGISERLLKAAIDYARKEGAEMVEAYPVDPESPSYRFMGFLGLFERAGFKRVGSVGTRRHVVRLRIA